MYIQSYSLYREMMSVLLLDSYLIFLKVLQYVVGPRSLGHKNRESYSRGFKYCTWTFRLLIKSRGTFQRKMSLHAG